MVQYEVRKMNCDVSIPRKLGKSTIVTHGTLRVKCQKVSRFFINNQTRLNPILGLGQLSVES